MATGCTARRRIRRTVACGAALWVAAPWVGGTALPAGSIEHVFVLLPLVAMPILLRLVADLLSPVDEGVTVRAQPWASLGVLASMLVAKGPLAALLAVPWLLLAVSIAITGVRGGVFAPGRARPSLVAAHAFLVVGAAWLVLARLGVGPASLREVEVTLAAVHFHFSGFALQVVIAATARRIGAARWIGVGGIVGLVMIAAGKMGGVVAATSLGVATMVAVALTIAVMSTALARTTHGPTRALFGIAAGAVTLAMVLAAAYRLGVLGAISPIPIARMATTHGVLDVVFVVSAALGQLGLGCAVGPARRANA